MHFAGAGMEAGTRSERMYLLYVLAICCVFLVAMWAAVLDAVEGLFALADTATCTVVVQAVLTVPLAAMVACGLWGLHASPLKLSHPDCAFLAASPLDARALVGVAACFQALGIGAAAGLGGFLLGAGLRSAGALAASPWLVACAAGLAAMAGAVAGWLPGVARLAWFPSRGKVAALAVATLAAAASAGVGMLWLAQPEALFGIGFFMAVAGGALAMLAASGAALAALAPRIDMTAVLRESALFADLRAFGVFSPLDRDTVGGYRRRRKLAARKPLLRLPRCEGRAALVARAALCQMRRYDGLPSLLVQGALVAPLGVLAIGGAGGPVLFLFWLQALLMAPQGAREATRAFADDMHNRLVRDRLPFGTLELLAFGSLPAFLLVCAVSCICVACVVPALADGGLLAAATAGGAAPMGSAGAAASGAWDLFATLRGSLHPGLSPEVGAALVVLGNLAAVLSCGLDAVRLPARGPRLCYEYGVLAFVGAAFALSLFAPPAAVAAALAVLCAALAALVHFGAECAG